jgi:hypothetical protein
MTQKKSFKAMADVPGSSSHPHGPLLGDWSSCSVLHIQLSHLQTQRFLPSADLVPVCAGLISIDGRAFAKNSPAITQCVQPLQQRGHPLWCYNRTNNVTLHQRHGPDNKVALAKILADLYKGDEAEFARMSIREGCSGYNPADWVSHNPLL